METVVDYTLSEMILLAAKKLDEQGRTTFTAEDLIVESWRGFPKAFGLRGYAQQFPDSNRVLASIMGERGLARKGWLAKVGQKQYALSDKGRRMLRRLLEGVVEPEPEDEEPPPRLPREYDKIILGLLDSSAFAKIAAEKNQDLSFGDACRFWGLTDNLSPEALDERLAQVEKAIRVADRTAAKTGLQVGQRTISRKDAELLREAHEYLQERFSRHLLLLRARNR